jgi:hypothetical protein
VGVDGDDLVAVSHPANDVAQAVDFNLVVAQLFHFSGNSLDNFFFVARLGRNCNHVSQKPGHVCFVAFGGCLDRNKINVHGFTPVKLDKYIFQLDSSGHAQSLGAKRKALESHFMDSPSNKSFAITQHHCAHCVAHFCSQTFNIHASADGGRFCVSACPEHAVGDHGPARCDWNSP